MNISIVIPVFEESKKIADDIEAAVSFLNKNNFSGEIIVVDDGSKDITAETAKQAGRDLPDTIELKVERYIPHRGKGYAVRTGIKQSCGEYVMFIDSGNCVPFEDVLRGLKLIKSGQCDIAHGSRKIQGTYIEKGQSLYRKICSKLFHWFVIYDMKIPAELTDTQCGFKLYRGDIARGLYAECITDGFMFDIEIIMRAQRQGYHITEFAIDWRCDRDSRLSPARSFVNVIRELMTIRRILGKRYTAPTSRQ